MFIYVGGKHSIAKWLIQYYPEHKIYVEPFGGAASMFFYKKESEKEVYNDINSAMANLFRVLRDEEKTNKLIRMFEYFVHSVEFSLEAWENYQNQEKSDIERAYYTIYLLQTGRGHFNKYASLNGVRSLESNQENITKKIKEVHRRFKNVVIENVDWKDCFRRYDSEETFFYCDPPYLVYDIKRIYKDAMTEKEHLELLEKIKECKGMVIISGYDNELYKKELEDCGWAKKQYKTSVKFSIHENSRKNNKGERIETIWIKPNCLSKTQQLLLHP